MPQENYLDLFDFQGTDKEKKELQSYVEGLSALPTGRKILEKAKNCFVKKTIQVFYKEDDCEWAGAGACYDKGQIIVHPKMKLENFPEEVREEKRKYFTHLMGHEIFHLTQDSLHILEKKPLNTIQKIYLNLLVEGEAYATEEILRAELNNKEIPSYQKKLISFVTGKQPESANAKKLSMLYTPLYIDAKIKSGLKDKVANMSMPNEEFFQQVKGALGNPEWIDDISYEKCPWIQPRPMGGTYISGNRSMIWLDKENAPVYTFIYDNGRFNSYIDYSSDKIFVLRRLKRPLFDSEVIGIKKSLETSGKVDPNCVKENEKLPPDIRCLCQFISWQNKEQQNTLAAIQKKRQNQKY